MSEINILPSQLESTEFSRQMLTVTANSKQEPDSFLNPKVWAAISPKIRPCDEITVISEDGLWIQKLYVTSVGQGWVSVFEMDRHDLSEAIEGEDPEDEYIVKWRGARGGKWCVVRTDDNSIIIKGIDTKEDAHKQKNDYIKSLGM